MTERCMWRMVVLTLLVAHPALTTAQDITAAPPSVPVDLATPLYGGPHGLHEPTSPGNSGPVSQHGAQPHARAPSRGGRRGGSSGAGGAGSSGGSTTKPGPRGTTRGPSRGRSKARTYPWLNRVRVKWQPAFLPTFQRPGYQDRPQSISSALRADPAEGGWITENRPTLVLRWNSSKPEHRRTLEALEMDRRFVGASHLFNCFRVESTALDRRNQEFVELSLFDRDGALLGRISGTGRLRGGFKLLCEAWQSCNSWKLTRIMPTLNEVLGSLAHTQYHARYLRKQLVDRTSGKVDARITQRIERTNQIARDWKDVLQGIRAGIVR